MVADFQCSGALKMTMLGSWDTKRNIRVEMFTFSLLYLDHRDIPLLPKLNKVYISYVLYHIKRVEGVGRGGFEKNIGTGNCGEGALTNCNHLLVTAPLSLVTTTSLVTNQTIYEN